MSKSRKKRNKAGVSPPRNPLFNHPLLKKSHVHEKSNKAKRRAGKVNLNSCLRETDRYSQSGILNTILRISVFCFNSLTFKSMSYSV